MQVSAFSAKFKADFGHFWRVSACSGHFSAYFGRIGRWPIRPDMADTARFGPNQPIRRESSRIGANRAASARIEPSWRESEKKKKNADAVRRAGNRVGRRVPRRAASDAGAAPLVPRPCFLVYHMAKTYFFVP